jgi:uncharacterized RDD family membrane protein YckC
VADWINAEAFIAPTFGQRLGGRLLDGALMFIVGLPLALTLDRAAAVWLGTALAAAYEIIGVAVWGQTVGKRLAGTRVVSMVSPTLLPAQAAMRFAAYGGLAAVPTALGIPLVGQLWALAVVLPILRAPLHRGLHDMAARTIVVPTRT